MRKNLSKQDKTLKLCKEIKAYLSCEIARQTLLYNQWQVVAKHANNLLDRLNKLENK